MSDTRFRQFQFKPLIIALSVALVSPAAFAQGDGAQQHQQQEHRSSVQLSSSMNQDTTRGFQEGWLEGKLDTLILLNSQLNIFDIDSEVRGSTAYLTGTVDSLVEKELATNLALTVEGLDRVVNQLVIEEGTREQRGSEATGGLTQSVSDATTTATVKTKLLADDQIDGMDINVTTEQGVVILQGTVDTPLDKRLAERLAINTEGVRQVENRLEVN